MKINLTPAELIDQLRAWFFPKDRSIYLANNCYIYLPGSYQIATARISETVLAVAAPSITVAIPQTFRSVFLVCQTRTDLAAEADGVRVRFNGDVGANYDTIVISGTTATTATAVTRAGTSGIIARTEAANSRANNFNTWQISIDGYSLTNREKWAFCPISSAFGNLSADADMAVDIRQVHWRSLAAISNVQLFPSGGANFAAGTIVTLYGVL